MTKSSGSYGLSADIWSLGCTVLEMLTRSHPFPDMEWVRAFSLLNPKFPIIAFNP